MKLMRKLTVAVVTAATVGLLSNVGTAIAQNYGAREVDQDDFLVVAAPGSVLIPYRLYIIEQKTDERDCFEVNGENPGEVEPLWTTFDFSGICGRASDSNGYSIRVNGQDLGSDYILQIREVGGELVLLGTPRRGGRSITIGRTGGISDTGYTEIVLNPGWRITKRTFEGDVLGHNYFTNNATLAELLSEEDDIATQPPTTPEPPEEAEPELPFPDIEGDLYATQIARAVEIGVVSGFQDGTFRPREAVTREQAVSMVIEALRSKLPAGTTLPTVEVSSRPFPDVPVNRWSANKIALAKELGIVSGDQVGTFRPTAPVSRVELMAMLRQEALAIRRYTGLDANLAPTHEPVNFSDIDGHWGEDLITLMSAYCQVATPVNESGTAFRPDTPALRNYTSAAIVRLYDCGTGES